MTHYLNSKGKEVRITDMLTPHLENAHAKLVREAPHRAAEIAAMAAELRQRDAEQEVEAAVGMAQ